MSHNYGDTIPLHPSSAQSDMDEIESLMYDAPSATVLPARPPSPPRASIPISTSPPPPSSKPPLPASSGPFFFIVFLGLTLSWSASVKKSEVFAVAFAVLAAGAIILTLNVLLLGGHIIFFQSLSLLGYCLFPLDVGALICLLKDNVILKIIVVTVTLAWSSWAAYPFMSAAVNPRRKALAIYPVFLMYISVGFLIIAID
ncbi:unnamed protein product [Triticum turgidum subsp. durum]|uniref:Protein YIP n=1 Tax=Triticum turgidum subsp. durum TaxID=4567 RepID=A0A9R1S6Q1_TRITD|nr:unnamed protein product [Triticum turgidum subsp. durum]